MNKTTNTKTLARYYEFLNADDWEGSTVELASLVTDFGIELGIIEANRPLTARLVRDYVSRKIIDKPERRGKEVYYRAKHADQLLEARQLLNGGLKLQALPAVIKSREVEAIRIQSNSVDHWGVAETRGIDLKSEAQRAIDDIREKYDQESPLLVREKRSSQAGMNISLSCSSSALTEQKEIESLISQYSSKLRTTDQLRELRYRLSGDASDFPVSDQKRIELASGIELIIDPEKISSLPNDEIRLIVRAIEILLDQIINKRK